MPAGIETAERSVNDRFKARDPGLTSVEEDPETGSPVGVVGGDESELGASRDPPGFRPGVAFVDPTMTPP